MRTKHLLPVNIVRDMVALALWLAVAMSASAAEIGFSGILPGVTLVKKPVVSMSEERYQNMVRQSTDFSCGAATLATILKYAYGMDVNEASVMQGLLKVSDRELVMEKGFSLLDLKRYVQTMDGMTAKGYRVEPERLLQLKLPVIVMLDLDGYKHFVVFKRLVDRQVYIADPSLGNRVLPLEKFIAAWESRVLLAVVGRGFNKDTRLLHVETQPTARHWLAANGPLTDSELLDFGFNHAALF